MTEPCKYDAKIAELESCIKLHVKYLTEIVDTAKTDFKESVKVAKDEIKEDVGIAKAEMDRRLEGMNDFRHQLDAQTKDFANRKVIDAELRRINDHIEKLWAVINTQRGGTKWSDHIITVLIGLGVVLTVYVITK